MSISLLLILNPITTKLAFKGHIFVSIGGIIIGCICHLYLSPYILSIHLCGCYPKFKKQDFYQRATKVYFNIMSSSMMGLSSIHAWYFRMKSTWTSFITSLSLVSINLHQDFGNCVKREKIWAIYILLWRWLCVSIDMWLIQVYWEPIFKFNGKHSIVSIKLFIGCEVWILIKCMHDKTMILKYLHGNQCNKTFLYW